MTRLNMFKYHRFGPLNVVHVLLGEFKNMCLKILKHAFVIICSIWHWWDLCFTIP